MAEPDDSLRYYLDELSYLRRMGQEFARLYPKIASRLEISESTVEKQVAKGLLVCAEFMAEMGYPVNEGRKQRKQGSARVERSK